MLSGKSSSPPRGGRARAWLVTLCLPAALLNLSLLTCTHHTTVLTWEPHNTTTLPNIIYTYILYTAYSGACITGQYSRVVISVERSNHASPSVGCCCYRRRGWPSPGPPTDRLPNVLLQPHVNMGTPAPQYNHRQTLYIPTYFTLLIVVLPGLTWTTHRQITCSTTAATAATQC